MASCVRLLQQQNFNSITISVCLRRVQTRCIRKLCGKTRPFLNVCVRRGYTYICRMYFVLVGSVWFHCCCRWHGRSGDEQLEAFLETLLMEIGIWGVGNRKRERQWRRPLTWNNRDPYWRTGFVYLKWMRNAWNAASQSIVRSPSAIQCVCLPASIWILENVVLWLWYWKWKMEDKLSTLFSHIDFKMIRNFTQGQRQKEIDWLL